MFEVDTAELRALAVQLRRAEVDRAKVAPVVSKAALNIKNQLQSEASRSRHFRVDRHINYDLDPDGMGAEIGPEKVGAGNLANIAYFGGSRGGGGSLPDPQGALDAESSAFEDYLAGIAEQAVLG